MTPTRIYSRRDGAPAEAFRDFAQVAFRGNPFRIDEETYRAYRDDEDEPSVVADHPIVMYDGSDRRCDFAYLVGDGEAFPHLGFWRDGGAYWCQRIADQLVVNVDGTEWSLRARREGS
jgi:hypothetical protein